MKLNICCSRHRPLQIFPDLSQNFMLLRQIRGIPARDSSFLFSACFKKFYRIFSIFERFLAARHIHIFRGNTSLLKNKDYFHHCRRSFNAWLFKLPFHFALSLLRISTFVVYTTVEKCKQKNSLFISLSTCTKMYFQ